MQFLHLYNIFNIFKGLSSRHFGSKINKVYEATLLKFKQDYEAKLVPKLTKKPKKPYQLKVLSIYLTNLFFIVIF